MLEYEITPGPDASDGALVLVLLHGRGADMKDLQGLAPGLPDEVVLVTPQAPFPGAPWGYGPGWAWYRHVHEDRLECHTLGESLARLGEFLKRLPEILPVESDSVALGGFSQGGTTSMAYALANPGQVSRVLNFSGFVADCPSVVVSPDTVGDTRFFWGHGTADGAVPFELAPKGRSRLEDAGADLTARDYHIGHWIAPEELADAVRWLLSPPARSRPAPPAGRE